MPQIILMQPMKTHDLRQCFFSKVQTEVQIHEHVTLTVSSHFILFYGPVSLIETLCTSAGQKVWSFYGHAIQKGYPKSLSSMGLPHSVKHITAAFHDPDTGKTLFFVDKHYYRYMQHYFILRDN